MHVEYVSVSEDLQYDPNLISEPLKTQIENFKFYEFYEVQIYIFQFEIYSIEIKFSLSLIIWQKVLKPRSRMFRTKKPQEILRVKLETLGGGSLLKLNKSESRLAEEIFELVLRVMH